MSNDTGERVRALRTARAVAQADLAASVGVSKSYLSHIEAGRRPVSTDLLTRLADALAVDVAQLETGTPADAHEDLQLKLSFAEMSLRNGEWDLARQEFQAVMERAGSLPLDAVRRRGHVGPRARRGGHRLPGAGDPHLREPAREAGAEPRRAADHRLGPPGDGLQRVRRPRPGRRRGRAGPGPRWSGWTRPRTWASTSS